MLSERSGWGNEVDYLGHYPGTLIDHLITAMSPFVRLEVGRARVVPSVERPIIRASM